MDSNDKIFNLVSPYKPTGDQPQAISEICKSFEGSTRDHTLIGVTGSGKTFTMANIIQAQNKGTLIIAPNKTLAAQLFLEFKELFPDNAVEFFISYYDYYQPEAYIPNTDTYIEKDASINDDIDKMRHSATRSLFERKDVIIVASVSCIYGLGSPESYAKLVVNIKKGDEFDRNEFLSKLIAIQYSRSDNAFVRGTFRVRGDIVDVLPSHLMDEAVRVEFFDDKIEEILLIDALSGKSLRKIEKVSFYPNSHYVAERDDMHKIINEILNDLGVRLRELKELGKLIEYQRIEQRVMHDIELLEQLGWCPGIENYSRYLTGLPPGHPPPTLLDYFPKDFLIMLDESHITVPQLRAMYRGDRSRKQTLVEYGFRLPSALDNRPLNFTEFNQRVHQILYVSATPGNYEYDVSGDNISEQIIRPTGLLEPVIYVKPAKNQVDDLYGEILKTIKDKGRILVTTLTKKMSEDLSSYYENLGLKVKYLHSDIKSLERTDILQGFRNGDFDVLIGINLLREGLDLPEVKLVAIMDADKEGFLRSKTSLIQVTGRAARNKDSRVIFYADKITHSMNECIKETNRRRIKQDNYNKAHGIIPKTIQKKISSGLREIYGLVAPVSEKNEAALSFSEILKQYKIKSLHDIDRLIRSKTKKMQRVASKLDFEQAAEIRDEIKILKELLLTYSNREENEK